MGTPNRCDFAAVRTSGDPIHDRSADHTATGWRHSRIVPGRFAGHQQDQSRAASDRIPQGVIKNRMGAGQAVAMEVDGAVGAGIAARQALVPIGVKRIGRRCRLRGERLDDRLWLDRAKRYSLCDVPERERGKGGREASLPQWPDRCRQLAPQAGFVRA